MGREAVSAFQALARQIHGLASGVVGTYYFFQRDVRRIDGRLDAIQQQMTPAISVPAPSVPGAGKKHR
ncbi:hypothetical protein ACPOL_5476 [Acidisarcina polymorpha]|uniref:Uncharacterized protein n=1 Tax=Acidisarcina polymorpha TaxID=2211140 RepID=A0A2Z5G7P4_9BACT|nr:hypothetical protein [Acidisarcina polymorpha]AXC14724.1 hypothetical protein ACPOL_5476 [Acidisarcina polymorpha]